MNEILKIRQEGRNSPNFLSFISQLDDTFRFQVVIGTSFCEVKCVCVILCLIKNCAINSDLHCAPIVENKVDDEKVVYQS